MAEVIEKRPRSVGTADSLEETTVTLEVPELKTRMTLWMFDKSGELKNGTEDIKFDTRSFDFKVELEVKNQVIRYTHVVKRLPGEIIPSKCKKKFYSGKVVLILAKAKEESWEATLASTGLDLEY